jgi:hypothetical protein
MDKSMVGESSHGIMALFIRENSKKELYKERVPLLTKQKTTHTMDSIARI